MTGGQQARRILQAFAAAGRKGPCLLNREREEKPAMRGGCRCQWGITGTIGGMAGGGAAGLAPFTRRTICASSARFETAYALAKFGTLAISVAPQVVRQPSYATDTPLMVCMGSPVAMRQSAPQLHGSPTRATAMPPMV
jgi:hypothetical protein